MSCKNKLIERLKSKPNDFSIQELDTLMNKCGFQKSNRGKTSGSAIAYVHIETKLVFKIHAPHSPPILKRYQVEQALDYLKLVNEIWMKTLYRRG